jgi:hypothetical protein
MASEAVVNEQRAPGTSERTGSTGRTGEPVVIAYTTEDDAHPAVRLAAVQHARDHGCAVIAYAADAASVLAEPLPNQWASEGEDRRFGDRLTIEDLEFLGHAPIATQVREAQAGGVRSAFGWLPKDHGPGALAEYARAQGAHRVFVPGELEAVDELSGLLAGAPDAGDSAGAARVVVETVPSERTGASGG